MQQSQDVLQGRWLAIGAPRNGRVRSSGSKHESLASIHVLRIKRFDTLFYISHKNSSYRLLRHSEDIAERLGDRFASFVVGTVERAKTHGSDAV